jgi:hypothetical protein
MLAVAVVLVAAVRLMVVLVEAELVVVVRY